MISNSSHFEKTLALLERKKVKGELHTRNEKRRLWKLAKKYADGNIVEIGSFHAYSTIILAHAMNGHGNIFAIDPHIGKGCETDENSSGSEGDTWEQFNNNLRSANVQDHVNTFKMTSEEAAVEWQLPISVLWIDGSHRYKDVKKDVLLWQEHVIRNGTILFHDCWSIGVRRVIMEYILSNNVYTNFHYASCCMFSVINTDTDNAFHQIHRYFWLFMFRLRGMIENQKTTRTILKNFIQRFL